MANPTLTSAAATTIIKNTNICASLADGGLIVPLIVCVIFENATSRRFTAFSINSMHINMMIAFRRVKTPTIPIENNAMDRNM